MFMTWVPQLWRHILWQQVVSYTCLIALGLIFYFQPYVVSVVHGYLLGAGFVPQDYEAKVLVKYFDYAMWTLVLGFAGQEVAGGFMYFKYRAKPHEYALFQQRMQEMSHEAGISSPKLMIIERASRVLNAAASHSILFGNKIIVMGRLLETLTDEQSDAVLAHEIAHHKHRDLWPLVFIHAGSGAISWQKFSILGSMIWDLFARGLREFAFLFTAWAVLSLTHTLYKLIMAAFSRAREYQADVGATKLIGWQNRHALITGLAGIMHAMTGWQPTRIFRPHPDDRSIWHSHPHIEDRKKALLISAEERADGGVVLRDATA
jgi:Zn-dependent protease with chaperone function